MIGMFKGTVAGRSPKGAGFVVLHRELRSFLSRFNGSEWLVLTSLLLDADENGTCCPSVARITAVTGLSDKSVRTSLKSLCTVQIRGFVVLRAEERRSASGRKTSNLYRIMPDGFPELGESDQVGEPDCTSGKFYRQEDDQEPENESPPVNFGEYTPLKYNYTENTYPPIIPPPAVNFTGGQEEKPKRQSRKRDSIKMPNDSDPARDLFIAYREEVYGIEFAEAFTLGEWRGAHHVLRSMQGAKVTPDQVRMGTRTLLARWNGNISMVTLNALWKHWTASQTEVDQLGATRKLVERSGEIFDQVVGWQK